MRRSSHRAELVESRIQLNSQELSNKAIRSCLEADARCFCLLRRLGRRRRSEPCQHLPEPRSAILRQRRPAFPWTIPARAATSYGSTLNQLVNSTAPDKGTGLQLNIPLRNRAAQAVQVRGELEYRQAQMALQQTENRVSIEVRQAQFAVEQNHASVASAKAAVDYARQSLDAEQKKYQFGTSTTTAVLQTRSALATSESTLMSAMAAYEKVARRTRSRRRNAARSERHQHRRRRPRPGHAHAQRSLRRSAERFAGRRSRRK